MPIRSVMVLLMLLATGALGVIAYQLSHRPSAQATVVAPAPKINYFVAARPLSPGTLARMQDFTSRSLPASEVPEGAIQDTDDTRAELRSSLIRRYLEPGAPVTRADLMRPHERGFLAAVLAPDTRAVSIPVNAVSGVAGLISPGDRVDVILTQEQQGSAAQGGHLVTSERVLSDVLVIAVDQDIAQGAQPNGSGQARAPATVTIQATVEQAERIAVAGRLGTLSLAVRSVDVGNEQDQPPRAAITSADVSRAFARPGAIEGPRMHVIQGNERSEVTFK